MAGASTPQSQSSYHLDTMKSNVICVTPGKLTVYSIELISLVRGLSPICQEELTVGPFGYHLPNAIYLTLFSGSSGLKW